MQRFFGIAVTVIILLSLVYTPVQAKEVPYVYTPTVPATALSVIALYKAHDYSYVLDGCTWLQELKTPDGAWAYQYGMAPQAKYTALAVMALMRGESIARGMFNRTIHAGVYWLLYKQSDNGSFGDYTDTALAVVALKEYERFKYSWIPVKKAIQNGLYYLQTHQPKTTMDRIFGYMALGDLQGLKSAQATGVNGLYRAFAVAYLTGKPVEMSSSLTDPASLALLLYATGDEQYEKALIREMHFGFWGVLKYQPPDLLEAAALPGFSDLAPTACPYMGKVKPQFEWEKVVLSRYYVECNGSVSFAGIDYSKLKPWMIAEMARINHLLGRPYRNEVKYLTGHMSGGWGNFFNTAYVVWVLSDLNVTLNYTKPLNLLVSNLTYRYPNYYYAYALMDFHRFNYTDAFRMTYSIIKSRQNPSGAWGYTAGAPGNIKSTAEVLRALRAVGLDNTTVYRRGYRFIHNFLYADIPLATLNGTSVALRDAVFFPIKDEVYLGNVTGTLSTAGLDGYIMMYPAVHPLVVNATPLRGFTAGSPWRESHIGEGHHASTGWQYIPYLVGIVLLAALGTYLMLRREGEGKTRNKGSRK